MALYLQTILIMIGRVINRDCQCLTFESTNIKKKDLQDAISVLL